MENSHMEAVDGPNNLKYQARKMHNKKDPLPVSRPVRFQPPANATAEERDVFRSILFETEEAFLAHQRRDENVHFVCLA